MNYKVKIGLAKIISYMPTSALRVALYRSLMGYKITKSRIGWRTSIAVNKATINGSVIAGHTVFVGPMEISIGAGSSVGSGNRFECGWWTASGQYRDANFARHLIINGSNITNDHHFDVAGRLTIGKDSWIAGTGSQFWTHGIGAKDRDVSIGDNCYIGTAVRFAPGASVADNVIVSLGSVVTHSIPDSFALVAGVPAKVVRSGYDWRQKMTQ